ncbi:MAG: NAD(P)H-dependent oxidoreductase, partial [Erysipelotrichaceae bacterium]
SQLSKNNQNEVVEFSLPVDMPHFCVGCFGCITKGEASCPHASNVQPIAKALLDADLIILTSSVYGMDVTGQMKTLLDHLCYLWMSHRPNVKMFNKIALTITTTAGAGGAHATKTLGNSLKFWGVKRIVKAKYNVGAMRWEDVTERNRRKIVKSIEAKARKIESNVSRRNQLSAMPFTRIFFWMMQGMMKKNGWNLTDRNHWEKMGWLDNAHPF